MKIIAFCQSLLVGKEGRSIPNISPQNKFHSDWMKNAEVENFQSGLVWLLGLVGQNTVIASFYVFAPLFKNLKRVAVRDGICGVSVDALKYCCSHFKLILCCFWFINSPHTRFHPNRTKNTEVRNFQYQSVLVGRFWLSGWWVEKQCNVGISNSF